MNCIKCGTEQPLGTQVCTLCGFQIGQYSMPNPARQPIPMDEILTQYPNRNYVSLILKTLGILGLVVIPILLITSMITHNHPQQISQSTTTSSEPESDVTSSQTGPLQIPPSSNNSNVIGTVDIYRVDSFVLKKPQTCSVRLRPSESAFQLSEEEFKHQYTDIRIPCNSTIQVLEFKNPYYHVTTNLNGNSLTGWIYAATTNNWQLPENNTPRVCQLNRSMTYIRSDGQLVKGAPAGNRYVIDTVSDLEVTLIDTNLSKITLPVEACELER